MTAAPRLLVTGAAGYLGAYTVAAARAAGHPVTAVTRREAPAPWSADPGVTALVLDLAAPDAATALAPHLAEAAAVIHCAAALAGGDAAHARDTLGPTAALLDALAACPAPRPRLVLASSLSVHGYAALPPGATLDETTPLEPDPHLRDAYARAKLAQEALCLAAAQTRGVATRALRIGAITGPGRLWTARLGIRKGLLALLVGGDAPLPLVHVDDCAEALVRAATLPLGPSDVAIPPDTPSGGHFEAIAVVATDQPTQRAWLAALRASGQAPRTIRVPLAPLAAAATATGLAGILLPGLPRRAPGLLRRETLDARFKPLRFANARLADRLGLASFRPPDAPLPEAAP